MNPYWLIIALTLLTQFFVFLRWLHRRIRDAEIERAFVRDMATHHLPHIYHAIQLVAAHLEIPLHETPPLRFLDLSARDESQVNGAWPWSH